MKKRCSTSETTAESEEDFSIDSDSGSSAQQKSGGVRNKQLRALYRISDLVNSTLNNKTLLRRIVRETVESFDASGGLIAVSTDPETVSLRVEFDQRIDARNIRTGTILPPDHVADEAFRADKLLVRVVTKPAPKTEMAVPLKIDGKPTGVLSVRWRGLHKISTNDRRLLTAVAAQASRVLQTSRLYDRLSRQAERLENLFEIGQSLISNDPLSVVLNRITEELLSIMEIKQCTLLLVGSGHDLQLSASSGGEGGTYAQTRQLGDSLVQKLSSRGEPIRVLDIKPSQDRRPGKAPRVERKSSLLAVPVFYQQVLVGILNVYTETPRNFDPEEMRLLKAYASLCGVAIENARERERLLTVADSIRTADRANTIRTLADEIGRTMRNSLTSSRLLLDLLHEDGAFPAEHAGAYEQLLANIDDINQTIAVSQELGRRRPPNFQWIAINPVVDEVLGLVQHRLVAQQIKVHRRFTAELPRVLADPAEIQAAVLAAVSNAIEAMHHGGLLSVSTSLLDLQTDDGAPGAAVRINVRDTGPGLDKSLADGLLAPFDRDATTRAGVGLFVAVKILQKYGARMTIRNAADHGTSVSITLPADGDVP